MASILSWPAGVPIMLSELLSVPQHLSIFLDKMTWLLLIWGDSLKAVAPINADPMSNGFIGLFSPLYCSSYCFIRFELRKLRVVIFPLKVGPFLISATIRGRLLGWRDDWNLSSMVDRLLEVRMEACGGLREVPISAIFRFSLLVLEIEMLRLRINELKFWRNI